MIEDDELLLAKAIVIHDLIDGFQDDMWSSCYEEHEALEKLINTILQGMGIVIDNMKQVFKDEQKDRCDCR